MEVVSLFFSILAVIISVTVAIVEYKRDYKINKVNLEAEYYKSIYEEHLVQKIPNARKYIRFDGNNALSDVDPMIDELQELLKDSLYFFYNNKLFYETLKTSVQELENYLVQECGRVRNYAEQNEILEKINNCIKSIYQIISQGYNGKYL